MTLCAACGLPGHRYGRNEGMERFDPIACINQLRGELEKRTLPGFSECPECDGEGRFSYVDWRQADPDWTVCSSCSGLGVVPDPETVEAVVADRISRNEGFPPSTFDNLRSDARAVLLKYAEIAKEQT